MRSLFIDNHDYYTGGMVLPGRSFNQNAYRYGFNGKEKDDEIAGNGSDYDFGARQYDSRLGKFFSCDALKHMLPNHSPYIYSLDNPINVIDEDGNFPILINGNTSSDAERASAKYWDNGLKKIISAGTGYSLDKFKYVDGNKGKWPNDRKAEGVKIGKLDAADVWSKMKETMKDGKITEQLQIFTHSRGTAFGVGYMEGLKAEIIKLAEKEKIDFAYGKEKIFEYSINLAPHQSDYIKFDKNNSSENNITVTHPKDPLSDDDATGDVKNYTTQPPAYISTDTDHENKTFIRDVGEILSAINQIKAKKNVQKK